MTVYKVLFVVWFVGWICHSFITTRTYDYDAWGHQKWSFWCLFMLGLLFATIFWPFLFAYNFVNGFRKGFAEGRQKND